MHQGIELHEPVANIWLHFACFSLQIRMAVPLSRRKRNRHPSPFPPCVLSPIPLEHRAWLQPHAYYFDITGKLGRSVIFRNSNDWSTINLLIVSPCLSGSTGHARKAYSHSSLPTTLPPLLVCEDWFAPLVCRN